MLFQIPSLPEPTAGPPADSALSWEVAGIYGLMNTKEMKMIFADLHLDIESVEALKRNLKHWKGMQFDVVLMQLKTMANLEQGMEEDFDIELQEVGQVAFDIEEL